MGVQQPLVCVCVRVRVLVRVRVCVCIRVRVCVCSAVCVLQAGCRRVCSSLWQPVSHDEDTAGVNNEESFLLGPVILIMLGKRDSCQRTRHTRTRTHIYTNVHVHTHTGTHRHARKHASTHTHTQIRFSEMCHSSYEDPDIRTK